MVLEKQPCGGIAASARTRQCVIQREKSLNKRMVWRIPESAGLYSTNRVGEHKMSLTNMWRRMMLRNRCHISLNN